MIPPMADPDAPFLDFAADVKKAINVPVIAVGRLGDPATATAGGRERQGRFHRARPHAGRRSAMGRQAARAASRSAAASPATPASTACAAAPASPAWSTARPAARAMFADANAAAGRAHRGDRRGPGRASPMRRWSPTATPSRCSRRTDAPAARSAIAGPCADVQGGRGQSGEPRALHQRHGGGLPAQAA